MSFNFVSFGITAHHSDELRPDGGMYLERQIESIVNNLKYEYKIYIIDNSSTYKLNIPNDERFTYHRVDDQTLPENGITGAWNLGLSMAYNDGSSIFLGHSDDLWFDSSINKFIEYIHQDLNNIDRVYGPVSNGILSGLQKQDGPIDRNFPMSNAHWGDNINGFFFGITRKHYEKYRIEDTKYFPHTNSYVKKSEGKWHGQEGQFIDNYKKGSRGFVIGSCFVHHDKIRGWKKLCSMGL